MNRFVAFEGIDGSGKTTVIKKIQDELNQKGLRVVSTCEPTNTWIGRCVQHCIKSQADPVVTAFTFISDRIVHGTEISRWLEKYDVVLCDRYAYSTYAYQGAQLEKDMNDPMRWLQDLSRNRFPVPDVTFLFDIDPEIAIQRIQGRDELIPFEKVSFLTKVRKNYQLLSENDQCVTLDATLTRDQLTKQCIEKILS